MDEGYLTNTNSRFVGNKATNGNGGGTCLGSGGTLTNTQFMSNTATATGGGVHALGDSTMSGVQFISNSAGGGGGGINTDGFMVSMTGGLFQNNRATNDNGGAMQAGKSGVNITITNTQFTGNTANRGGAVYVNGTLALSDTQFITNTASAGGGAIYSNNSITDTLGYFSGNVGTSYCGAIRTNSRGYFQDTRFISNRTSGEGGAGCIDGGLTAINTQVLSNTAESNGGGFKAGGTGSYITAGLFQNNSGGNGGAAYLSGSSTISSTTFINNRASNGGSSTGGGIRVNGGTLTLVNSLLARNQADSNGSGIYINVGAAADIIHTTIASPTLASGQAIYVSSGTTNITNTIVASHTTGIENVGGTVNEDYNLFYANTTNLVGTVTSGGHSHSGFDPIFAAPASDDHHLSEGSAAIDRGVDAGIKVDFEGDIRPQGDGFDIGYDESPFTILAVKLGWFMAERNGETVDFRWQTATETGTAGFNLLTADGDGRVQLNAGLIPSPVIDSVEPTDYRTTAVTPAAQFYLQEVGISGQVIEYGPFELGKPFGANANPVVFELAPQVWLPFVQSSR